MSRAIAFPDVSKLVDLPPDVAAVAFDAVLADLREADGITASLVTPSGRLRLQPPARKTPPQRCYLPLRQASGLLRTQRGWAGAEVMVEVLPWSVRKTEVTVRVTRPPAALFGRLSPPVYLQLAREAVDDLAASVEAWPVGFLGGLVDRPEPLPAAPAVRVHRLDILPAVRLRPIEPADAEALMEFHRRLSPRSRYYRFLSPKPELTRKEADWFAGVDFDERVAFVATIQEASLERIVGVARFDRISSDRAEFAIVVRDDHQRRGIGTALFSCLVVAARARRIGELVGQVLHENAAMFRFSARVGAKRTSSRGGGNEVVVKTAPAAGTAA